jgi:GNAT superfamily N-acetyltransferase
MLMRHDAIMIRQATEADAPVLAEHRVGMFRDMGSAAPAIEAPLRAAATAQIREAMLAGEYVAWLAHPDGEPGRIVGGAGVQIRRLLPRPDTDRARVLIGREGIVLNVYVEREYRRRGVARRLMETILSWATGTDIVRLVLHASDEGRPLYESMGFEPTNEMRYTRPLRR